MRTYDAFFHNLIANHPDVVHNIEHDPALGPITFDDLCLEPAYFALLHNGGKRPRVEYTDGKPALVNWPDAASIFEFRGPGIWISHSLFLPSCRGKLAITAGKGFVHEMFTEHGADILWGETPLTNRRAIMFNRFLGAKARGTGVHSVSGPVQYFRIDKEEWLRDHWVDHAA